MIGGATTKLGVVLVVAGALLMAGPAFGFSTLAADRGVNVATANDSDALLGIDTNENVELGKDGEVTVATLSNNAGSDFDELQTTVRPGILSVRGDGFSSQLGAGNSTTLDVECGEATGNGMETVEFTVSKASSSDAGLSISRQAMSVTVDYDCKGSSKGDFNITDVEVTGSTITFDVENEGSKKAKVSGLSLDYTTADATGVANDPEPEVTFDTAEIDASDSIPIDSEYREFTNTNKYEVDSGDTVSVTIESFRKDGTAVNMTGEELRVTLYSQEGSGTPVEQLIISDST